MITIPDAFYLLIGVCVILASTAFIKACYVWLTRVEDDQNSQHFCEVLAIKTHHEILIIRSMLERICDELGIDYDTLEREYYQQESEELNE